MMCVTSGFSSSILRICTAPAPLNRIAMRTTVIQHNDRMDVYLFLTQSEINLLREASKFKSQFPSYCYSISICLLVVVVHVCGSCITIKAIHFKIMVSFFCEFEVNIVKYV